MKNIFSWELTTKIIFIFIALASTLSMAINTGSIELFLRYFSISSNMIIVFVMVYLTLYISDYKKLESKKLPKKLLLWVLIYLILWNGLPFIYWFYVFGIKGLVETSDTSTILFLFNNLLQIVIIPFCLYIILWYKINSFFQEKKWKYFKIIDALIMSWVFVWVSYLVIAAMR